MYVDRANICRYTINFYRMDNPLTYLLLDVKLYAQTIWQTSRIYIEISQPSFTVESANSLPNITLIRSERNAQSYA